MDIIADSHIPYIRDYFSPYGNLTLLEGRQIAPADVKNADVLIVRSITKVNELLLAGSNIKFVGSVTAGADHLDTAYLDAKGIAWSVARGFNAPPVADYVVSVIAALRCQQLLPQKRLRAAVIGVGNVGRLVVERLKHLKFEIILCDPLRALNEKDFSSVQLSEIADCDVITLHVPLTRGGEFPTYHFINKEFLQRQQPGCILINASRGGVIHSADLWHYGKHLQWCLDVWENEPHINKDILSQALIATPHIAGYSIQSKIRGIDMIYRILCEKEILQPLPVLTPLSTIQSVDFLAKELSWEEVVLRIFDPQRLTQTLKTSADRFDEMRNEFNSRYEFSFTKLNAQPLNMEDKKTLKKLGFRF